LEIKGFVCEVSVCKCKGHVLVCENNGKEEGGRLFHDSGVVTSAFGLFSESPYIVGVCFF
jgi:hypothetical protein